MSSALSPRTAAHINAKRSEALRRRRCKQVGDAGGTGDTGDSPYPTTQVMAVSDGSGVTADSKSAIDTGDGSPPNGDVLDGERPSVLVENGNTTGAHSIGSCHNQSQEEPAPQPELESSKAPLQDLSCLSCVSKEPESSNVPLQELGKDVPRMSDGDAGEHQHGDETPRDERVAAGTPSKVGDDHSVVREVVNETGNSGHEVADDGDHSAGKGGHEVVTETDKGRHEVHHEGCIESNCGSSSVQGVPGVAGIGVVASPVRKRPRLNWAATREDKEPDLASLVTGQGNGKPTTTLAEAYSWATQWLEKMMLENDDPNQPYSHTLNDWVVAMNSTTYSATFAGVDAPGTALLEWHHAITKLVDQERAKNRNLPNKYVGPRTMWLLEWDQACQRELNIHPGTDTDTCMFGDMSTIWKPTIQSLVEQVRKQKGGKVKEKLRASVKSGRAVHSRLMCLRHNRICPLRHCTLHIGGSPCTDHSLMGEKAGEEGKTMIDTLAWLAHILSVEHTVFVSENVHSEDLVRTIIDFLGHLYHIQVVRDEANPCRLGWPVNRARQFLVGFHKMKKAEPPIWLKNFVARFARPTTLTWRSLLVASELDLRSDKAWASIRKPVLQRLTARKLQYEDLDSLRFEDLLSDAEMEVLRNYRQLHSSSCAWSLNQYPQNDRPRISTPTTLHTVIKNVGLVWDDETGRWFTPSDLMAAQGFRYSGLDVATNSFQVPAKRKRTDTVEQMGNSMHVNAVGAVIAWCIGLKDKDSDAFQAELSATMLRKRRELRN